MTTLLFTHPSGIEHDPGPGHPERPDRLRAVLKALGDEDFAGLVRREAPRATLDQIARAHDRGYVDALLAAVPEEGWVGIDPDTVMCPESGEAALRAAGAIVAAVDAVVAGEAETAFCAVRPPGHHAEAGRGMGFCLFNNVAIGALHARAAHGIGRVAIVDFDVHHGNGTQAMFEDEPAVLFASTHQYPFYPGTGAADERGCGNVFNAPLAAGSGSSEFRRAMERLILPALSDFRPEMILVSAGFDAHARDPLAMLELGDDDYGWVTDRIREIAQASSQGRIVSTLEGGYDLQALAAGVTRHVRGLMA
jgi:acetoin utilization deacetylase AcuC-like enzyme